MYFYYFDWNTFVCESVQTAHVYRDVCRLNLIVNITTCQFFLQPCHLCAFTLANPVRYDLLSKCNCVSTEGEQLVFMRLSHQLDRLVSKLRSREYFF